MELNSQAGKISLCAAGLLLLLLNTASAAPKTSNPTSYPIDKCVVSGETLGEHGDVVIMERDGREMRFCCEMCINDFEKDPTTYLQKLDEEIIKAQLPGYPLETCVVSGKPLDVEPIVHVAGNRVFRLCSDACRKAVAAEPTQHLAMLDAAVVAAQLGSYSADTCPISGEKLGSMGDPFDYVFAGQLVRFCCAGCIGRFDENPQAAMSSSHGGQSSKPITKPSAARAIMANTITAGTGTRRPKPMTHPGARQLVKKPLRFGMSMTAIVIILGLTGCAASTEQAARKRWIDVHDLRFQTENPPAEVTRGEGHEITTLKDLLELGESTNPGLRAAFERWTAALEQVPQATALPDPRISYAYFIEPVETRVGPQRQRFGVSQSIPLFGKLGLRGEVAVSAANAVGAQFEASRRDLRFRLTQLWNDYYYLSRAISVTDENVRLLTYLESVALTQYTAGRTSHSVVIRSQVELGRLEDRLRTLRAQRAPLLAALNAELARPQDTPIAWPDSIDVLPMPLSQTELRSALLSRNPQLSAVSFMAEQASAAAKLAGKSPIPDLTIGAEYIATDEARFPGVLDSGKNAAVAKATINIPLWFGRYRAEKAQAEARHSAAENEETQLQNRLLADLERTHFEYRDAERQMDLYAFTLLPKARQSLEVTENSFTTGEADFLDLIDAQRTLLEFELAYERALVDRATMRAKLERITGIDIGNH